VSPDSVFDDAHLLHPHRDRGDRRGDDAIRASRRECKFNF
jgi:hypothetical protein